MKHTTYGDGLTEIEMKEVLLLDPKKILGLFTSTSKPSYPHPLLVAQNRALF
jgi:hypothetical protein